MSTVDWNLGTAIDPAELPAAITGYLAAHEARDADTAIASFTTDAVVTDEGKDHRGPDEIRAWMLRSAAEYTYTTELVGAREVDDGHYDVVHHLEGDFPGGEVDLHYRFTLRRRLIAALVIEP